MPSAETLSTGIDLIEIDRIRRCMDHPRFCSRILGVQEYEQLKARGFPVQSVAVSFCAKEAFSKAVSTGIRGFSLRDVELLRNPEGKPYFVLHNGALRVAREKGYCFDVSATHTKELACVMVVAYREKNA